MGLSALICVLCLLSSVESLGDGRSGRVLRGSETERSWPRACSAHPQCAHLTGDCCPTWDDKLLDCCEQASCMTHPLCDHLSGACCPTPDGVRLACCEPLKDPIVPPHSDDAKCSSRPACAHLDGDCCPTPTKGMLSCCYERANSPSPTPPPTSTPNPAPPIVENVSGTLEVSVRCQLLDGQPCHGAELSHLGFIQEDSIWSGTGCPRKLGFRIRFRTCDESTGIVRGCHENHTIFPAPGSNEEVFVTVMGGIGQPVPPSLLWEGWAKEGDIFYLGDHVRGTISMSLSTQESTQGGWYHTLDPETIQQSVVVQTCERGLAQLDTFGSFQVVSFSTGSGGSISNFNSQVDVNYVLKVTAPSSITDNSLTITSMTLGSVDVMGQLVRKTLAVGETVHFSVSSKLDLSHKQTHNVGVALLAETQNGAKYSGRGSVMYQAGSSPPPNIGVQLVCTSTDGQPCDGVQQRLGYCSEKPSMLAFRYDPAHCSQSTGQAHTCLEYNEGPFSGSGWGVIFVQVLDWNELGGDLDPLPVWTGHGLKEGDVFYLEGNELPDRAYVKLYIQGTLRQTTVIPTACDPAITQLDTFGSLQVVGWEAPTQSASHLLDLQYNLDMTIPPEIDSSSFTDMKVHLSAQGAGVLSATEEVVISGPFAPGQNIKVSATRQLALLDRYWYQYGYITSINTLVWTESNLGVIYKGWDFSSFEVGFRRRQCSAHPTCNAPNFTDECCPNQSGDFLQCCDSSVLVKAQEKT